MSDLRERALHLLQTIFGYPDFRGQQAEIVGHAGALIRRPDGALEGGADPRSDGGVAAY